MAFNYGALQAQLDLSGLRDGFRDARQFKALSEARKLDRERFDYEQSQDADKQARRAAFSQAFSSTIMNPSRAAFDKLGAEHPEYWEQVQGGWKSYNDGQRNDMLRESVTVLSAIKANKPELAIHALDKRKEALANTGIDTTETQAIRDMVASGDPAQMKAARGMMGLILAQATGDEFDTVWQSLNKVDNEEELQGDRKRAAAADADWKESRARFAPLKDQATIASRNAATANSRSVQAKRDAKREPRKPVEAQAGSYRDAPTKPTKNPGGLGTSAAIRRSAPTATGPGGRKYVVKGGKWVPAS